jgi:hypothetical protein
MTDTPLFDRPAAVQDLRENRSLRIRAPRRPPGDWTEEAIRWKAENGPIYRLMRATAYRWQLRFGWWSMKGVFEWARLHVRMKRRAGKWKLNNNLTPAIARMLCADLPWLATGCDMRDSRSDYTLGRPAGDERNCPGARNSD